MADSDWPRVFVHLHLQFRRRTFIVPLVLQVPLRLRVRCATNSSFVYHDHSRADQAHCTGLQKEWMVRYETNLTPAEAAVSPRWLRWLGVRLQSCYFAV